MIWEKNWKTKFLVLIKRIFSAKKSSRNPRLSLINIMETVHHQFQRQRSGWLSFDVAVQARKMRNVLDAQLADRILKLREIAESINISNDSVVSIWVSESFTQADLWTHPRLFVYFLLILIVLLSFRLHWWHILQSCYCNIIIIIYYYPLVQAGSVNILGGLNILSGR